MLDLGFTTSNDGSDGGSGMGLWFVDGITEPHGWRADLPESRGAEARFEFHSVEPASGRETP